MNELNWCKTCEKDVEGTWFEGLWEHMLHCPVCMTLLKTIPYTEEELKRAD